MTLPHYVLVAAAAPQNGSWSFKLGRSQQNWELRAADIEPTTRGQRLELLAVVRGLEALECPARVTLCTAVPGLARRIRRGLVRWELAAARAPRGGNGRELENADLWRRIDRLLQIHTVRFRRLRVDPAHEELAGEHHGLAEPTGLRAAIARFCSRLVPWTAA